MRERYRSLCESIRASGSEEGLNAVAFSGGVDSSLVAYTVFDQFAETSRAILAVSASLSTQQYDIAIAIAKYIGIPFEEIKTDEGENPQYVENTGMSCYFCKSALYFGMEALSNTLRSRKQSIVLFNGTNADDLLDRTRVGLIAAQEHSVVSPLSGYTKTEIRELARYVGLPNWNLAASPCLRSRLSIGVEATQANLSRIEQAENIVRSIVAIDPRVNFRVRHLPADTAMIEIDATLLPLIDLAVCSPPLLKLGFLNVSKRAYRSGAVAHAMFVKEPTVQTG